MNVYKLQRPVSEGGGDVLGYDQRKQHIFTLPMTDDLERLFIDKAKIFVEGELVDGQLIVGKRVPDRAW